MPGPGFHQPVCTQTLGSPKAKQWPGEEQRNIWHHCPPSLISRPHHRDEDRRAECERRCVSPFDLSVQVPLSKAPYSPNICSPGAVHGRSLLCVSCTRGVKSRAVTSRVTHGAVCAKNITPAQLL
ncbi:unnamed protein product [Pleuronectes platessa]|uniref:Uncharacterized protein n=1 Tax=Pleuronectes platessa TaxID=8262 RepID=A0A9N7TUT7_PLEPL|nr:unnamed protein product [Pleuronectes platessa]